MKNYNNINYKNNFINQVICRIDFIDFVPNEKLSASFIIEEIKKKFPKKEMDQIIRYNSMNIENLQTVHNESVDGIQSTYIDSNGNKFIISNKFMVIEFNKYSNFENFLGSFKDIIYLIFRKNRISTERIGLRYMNYFDSSKIKIQKSFFSPSIASDLSINIIECDERIKLVKSVQTIEYIYEDLHLNFRYGFLNKFYPAPITNNDFVLDYDCYIQEPFKTGDEIICYLDKSHDAIQELFENSITLKLRAVMQDEQ
jgi:uncharacterized protein (TIGR04255 family)